MIAILGQDENGETVQVEVLGQEELRALTGATAALTGGGGGDGVGSRDVIDQGTNKDHQVQSLDQTLMGHNIQIEMETPDGSVQTITVPASSLADGGPRGGGVKRRRKEGAGVGGAVAKSPDEKKRAVVGSQGGVVSVANRLAAGAGDKVDEVSVTHTFHEWMASVTERSDLISIRCSSS